MARTVWGTVIFIWIIMMNRWTTLYMTKNFYWIGGLAMDLSSVLSETFFLCPHQWNIENHTSKCSFKWSHASFPVILNKKIYLVFKGARKPIFKSMAQIQDLYLNCMQFSVREFFLRNSKHELYDNNTTVNIKG